MRALLRSGGFDLLHFAGHGAADAATIEDARILLAANRRDGQDMQEFLSATNVSANARWTRTGEVGPVVVLNACEVGQAGTQLVHRRWVRQGLPRRGGIRLRLVPVVGA